MERLTSELKHDWKAALAESRAIMIETATKRTTITYGDLCKRITAWEFKPNEPWLWHLLGEISTEEVIARRPMLSSVVVQKDEHVPGQGFFDLAREVSVYNKGHSDEMIWSRELGFTHDYWVKNTEKVA